MSLSNRGLQVRPLGRFRTARLQVAEWGNVHRSKRPSSVAALRPSSVALRRVERAEGNEGDAVGETPTGASGSPKAFGPIPQPFGLQPVKSLFELRGVLFPGKWPHGEGV